MRENLGLIAALLLVVLVGVVGYRVGFGPRGPSVVVIDVQGQAIRVRPQVGAEPVEAGDPVAVDDQLVVRGEGRLRLAIGAEGELTLPANSALRLTAVSDDGVQVELEEGRVSARVRAGGATLGIGARGRVLRLDNGEINAAVQQDGALSVEVLAGELAVQGVPLVATVGAGERLDHVEGSAAHTGPKDAPLPLQIVEVVSNDAGSAVVLRVLTVPGARVEWVDGRPPTAAVAGRDGFARLPAITVPPGACWWMFGQKTPWDALRFAPSASKTRAGRA